MNKQTRIIIALLLIIIGMVGFFSYNLIYLNAYEKGYQNANIYIIKSVLTDLEKMGYSPLTYIVGNETKTKILIEYKQT